MKASLCAQVVLTAKTHEPVIKFRNIHACSRWMFASLAHFVANAIGLVLGQNDFLVKDSIALASKLRNIIHKPNIRFAALDVEHFSMSGNPSDLARLKSELFEVGPIREAMFSAVSFLMDAQLCKVALFPSRLYRVVKGSGMGLPHSGAVADGALLRLAEHDLSDLMHEHHMLGYYRFKDDKLVAFVRGRSDFVEFGKKLKDKAVFFSKLAASVLAEIWIFWNFEFSKRMVISSSAESQEHGASCAEIILSIGSPEVDTRCVADYTFASQAQTL